MQCMLYYTLCLGDDAVNMYNVYRNSPFPITSKLFTVATNAFATDSHFLLSCLFALSHFLQCLLCLLAVLNEREVLFF